VAEPRPGVSRSVRHRASFDPTAYTLKMLFELAVYVTGAMVAIAGALKTQPWKRFQRHTLISIFVSLFSLISSALGGAFGIAKLGSGSDKEGIWAAIVVCAILFILNFGIFSYRVLYYYKSWKVGAWKYKSAKTFTECLRFSNFEKLGDV
jgi:hypothetical protein